MTEKNYPDVILKTPCNARTLARLFSYEARVYDLNAYEAVLPGLGRKLWKWFVEEEEHLKKMDAHRAKLDDLYNALCRPFGIFRIFGI
ncbi:MAG TPA: hypothetical protein VFS88_01465 [Micavibrio sp.]|nr:hypothetical protein [Micavibrio sp.]